MSTLPPNPRYERKFIAAGLTLSEVLALVRRHPAAFREIYPARAINNIYLDSPDLHDFHDHVNGVACRSKTRVRWYGPWSGSIERPALERKLKQGNLSGKISHALAPFSMNGCLSKAALEASFDNANLPPLARSSLRFLQPSLLNRYQRHYFQSADRGFRLTVDYGLQFAAPGWVPGAGVFFGPSSTQVVIELKFGPNEADSAERITNTLPFRMVRCSKYVLGINSL